jgi:uncharacterized protein (DUF2141 family)
MAVAAAVAAGTALADNAPAPDALAQYADPTSVVLAVKTAFPAPGGSVRVSVYDDKAFLENAILKQQATLDKDGVALLTLRGLDPGAYAFVAYYDANGDGRLNRGGLLGKPKEPVVFSNGVRPKLRKPHFDEAKIDVAPGSVVVLTLED